MISFEFLRGTATVGDTRCCSECGSTNVLDAEDAPLGMVQCSDCGLIDLPSDMAEWADDD